MSYESLAYKIHENGRHLGNRAAQVGDVIEVVAQETTGGFSSDKIRYTIKTNDIKVGKLSLGDLPMFPVPKKSALLQNYPNPFNPETWIPYQLSEDSDVTISIYNIAGQLVRRLELGDKIAGFYTSRQRAAPWDGRNDTGERVASGVYFYRIQAGNFSATRKMAIIK